MFRKLRILILLLTLATVGLGAWRANSRLTAWEHTVHVGIYPIAADDSPTTQSFVRTLDAEALSDIGEWMQAESQRYGKPVLRPISLNLAPPLDRSTTVAA